MTGETPAPAAMRHDYAADLGLIEADLAADWPSQFARWFADAMAAGLPEPNAMIVATADPAGRPSARTVLLKGVRRSAASSSSPTTPRARASRR